MCVCIRLQVCAHSITPGTGDLRLVGGDAPYEGRLEIYINGSGWGIICYQVYSDNGIFDLLEADTACRQLNYTRAAEVGTTGDL